MKKTILIILAVLPIVLLVIIAFAGRILSLYQYISVERVEFVDRAGNAYTDEFDLVVPQGGSKSVLVRIYPELATNKNVTYTSADTSICTIDSDGVIRGVHYGATTVTVKTKDGSKTATLNVVVKADIPYDVALSKNEQTMRPGEYYPLSVNVDAPVAIDQSVTYSSSDPSVVKVDATGMLSAVAPGVATITVTTNSGNLTDTCTVTVLDEPTALSFDFTGAEGVTAKGDGYIITAPSLDLFDYLTVADGINVDTVKISVNTTAVSLVDGVITNPGAGTLCILTVYAGEITDPACMIRLIILFN